MGLLFLFVSCNSSLNNPSFADNQFYFSFKFDETSGTNIIDSSKNGCNGKLQGGSRTTGKVNNGIAFSYPGAHIEVSYYFMNLAENNYYDTISIDGWMFPTEIDVSKKYFIFGGNNNEELSVEIINGKLVLLWDGNPYLTSNSTILVNAWTYFAITSDGNSMKIFINGVENVSSNVTFVIANYAIGVQYKIGSRMMFSSGTSYIDDYKGIIDEFKVWKIALSSQFVASEYTKY
jgi:hypothetical protein